MLKVLRSWRDHVRRRERKCHAEENECMAIIVYTPRRNASDINNVFRPCRNDEEYYEILGVQKSANAEEIRRAYRAKALLMHPDRNNGSGCAEFHRLQHAYSVLSDEKRRSIYDRYGLAGVEFLEGNDIDLEQFATPHYRISIIVLTVIGILTCCFCCNCCCMCCTACKDDRENEPTRVDSFENVIKTEPSACACNENSNSPVIVEGIY